MATGTRIDTREWDSFFKAIKKNARDSAPMLQRAYATEGFRDIMNHFRREEGPSGPWPQRAQTTDEWYDRMGGKFSSSNKLLQLTGNLRGSILPTSTERVSQQAIMIFTNVPYAAKHEYGDSAKGIPQRSFMWFSDSAMDKMANVILNLVDRK